MVTDTRDPDVREMIEGFELMLLGIEMMSRVDITLSGTGRTRFNGRDVEYEEYRSVLGDSFRFYFDGSRLVGMDDLAIFGLDRNVPNSVFEIPSHYMMF
jgi:hypothetical protein